MPLFILSVSCVDKLKEKIERKRMHHVSSIILNFIKIYLPHKNMKPWIMSSGNHESTSNQLKITAHLNTLSLCTLHHIVSFIEYEWHGNSSSFTTITMATNSMPAVHQTHQNVAHRRFMLAMILDFSVSSHPLAFLFSKFCVFAYLPHPSLAWWISFVLHIICSWGDVVHATNVDKYAPSRGVRECSVAWRGIWR